MPILKKMTNKLALALMLTGITVQAYATTTFTLTGNLAAVDGGNPFGLTACQEPLVACTDSISASGSFDETVFTAGFNLGDMIFELQTLDIFVGTAIFTNSMDSFFGYGELTLNAGSLVALDYSAVPPTNGATYNFDSIGLFFDSTTQLNGEWDASSYMTVVPIPAAIWLFGSGLLGLLGIARKKMV